jgi:hypothetical protein
MVTFLSLFPVGLVTRAVLDMFWVAEFDTVALINKFIAVPEANVGMDKYPILIGHLEDFKPFN